MDRSIGDLFRKYGEEYIKIYKPPHQHIKLIRAIRVCRTPALGGRAIICKSCGHRKNIYLSCGHSHCPLCQNKKRQLWQEKISDKFLDVPYVHTVFTIPHDLNTLARLNPKVIYNITMRSAWRSIKTLAEEPKNVGALPGMVAVLHTFGSDMKYHIHVHALITFGGIDKAYQWRWPKHDKKLASYREICRAFRDTFLKMLKKEIADKKLICPENMNEVIQSVQNKRWNVRNEYPTANTHVLEKYLARYINRVAISKSRLEFVSQQEKIDDQVNITYKDYRQQKKNQGAPMAVKSVDPLVAIDQFLLHILPPYFQKARYYGLHSSQTFRQIKDQIDKKLLRNNNTIRILFKILKYLAGLLPHTCDNCAAKEFEILPIRKNSNWIFQFITLPNHRGPPKGKTKLHVSFK